MACGAARSDAAFELGERGLGVTRAAVKGAEDCCRCIDPDKPKLDPKALRVFERRERSRARVRQAPEQPGTDPTSRGCFRRGRAGGDLPPSRQGGDRRDRSDRPARARARSRAGPRPASPWRQARGPSSVTAGRPEASRAVVWRSRTASTMATGSLISPARSAANDRSALLPILDPMEVGPVRPWV